METPPTDPNTVKVRRRGVSAKIYFVEIILIEPQSCEKPPQVFFSGLHIVTHRIRLETMKDYAIFFSRGTSQLRSQTQVSHIPGRFFSVWTTKEARWEEGLN